MVNCNPETVSTDYDTSDRLYFEPLDEEPCSRCSSASSRTASCIQFGGQTPLKLARAIERAGFRILGTPFDAVDLAEDRERFGRLAAASASAARVGIADAATRRRDRRADRLPGARAPVVRARRARDARLLRRATCDGIAGVDGPCSSTASSRTRSSSTSTRSATAARRTSRR
jgi:hypothetical protein